MGLTLTYLLSNASEMALDGNYLTMFIAGSIAVCAMILPGISGSYILVLLGLYSVFIDALANTQLDLLAVFAAGGVIGLMFFSRLLSWLLNNYSATVISTLCGFLIGSLSVMWPWKQVATSSLNSGDKTALSAVNLSPGDYQLLVGQDPQILSCIIALLLGLALVLVLELLGERLREASRSMD
jgi:putative membrane protein